MNMDESEELAFEVMSQHYENCRIDLVLDQSDGQHDFDVFDENNQLVAVVEVTSAIHEPSKVSLQRMNRHGPIECSSLKNSWLLMAYNPSPRDIQKIGVHCLATLEAHGYDEFDHNTRYHPIEDVAHAATKLNEIGIENGGGHAAEIGSIGFLTIYGESSESYILNPERIVEVAMMALMKPDNLRKLSADNHRQGIDRHFFVRVDASTHPDVGDCMDKVEPPKEKLDLGKHATHMWVAMRKGIKLIVWKGCATGWTLLTDTADGQ